MVFLTNTDTTIGFLSTDYKILNKIKKRNLNTKILQEVNSLNTLKQYQRIPNKFKNFIRKTKKTTFIYPSKKSFRVVKNSNHLNFLNKYKILYSTSANIHKQNFDYNYAFNIADIIIKNRNFIINNPSKIYKINKIKIKRLR